MFRDWERGRRGRRRASAEDFANAYVAATEGKDAFNKWWKENKEARQTFSEKQMVILKKATEDAESAN